MSYSNLPWHKGIHQVQSINQTIKFSKLYVQIINFTYLILVRTFCNFRQVAWTEGARKNNSTIFEWGCYLLVVNISQVFCRQLITSFLILICCRKYTICSFYWILDRQLTEIAEVMLNKVTKCYRFIKVSIYSFSFTFFRFNFVSIFLVVIFLTILSLSFIFIIWEVTILVWILADSRWCHTFFNIYNLIRIIYKNMHT
jgi:hypothetical protein